MHVCIYERVCRRQSVLDVGRDVSYSSHGLLSFFQKKKTNRVCVCVCVCLEFIGLDYDDFFCFYTDYGSGTGSVGTQVVRFGADCCQTLTVHFFRD
jgi:hypothetical protein